MHDLPDFVFFSHEIHVNKGIGCESCHGRVDEMPLMYAQNTLQMEWCLDCHRNPAKNLRPTSEIYNMAWEAPARRSARVVRGGDDKAGVPTAESVSCTTKDPSGIAGVEVAALRCPQRAQMARPAYVGNDALRAGFLPEVHQPGWIWAISWWTTTRFAPRKT